MLHLGLRIQAIVPIELLDIIVLGVSVSAVNLYCEIVSRQHPPYRHRETRTECILAHVPGRSGAAQELEALSTAIRSSL
jgi:hypothetical protein